MLKDPRWDNVPSLAGFALFVASKPANESYDWPNCRACAVGQYLASIGKDIPLSQWDGQLAVMNRIAHGRGDRETLSEMINRKDDWTFGLLADRILAYQMADPV